MQKTSFIRSPLKRWVGSKYDFLPEIYKLVPKDVERTVDPFCGSAVFSLNVVEGTGLSHLYKKNSRIISDHNGAIYYLLTYIKDKVDTLLESLQQYECLDTRSYYKNAVIGFNKGKSYKNYATIEDFERSRILCVCDFVFLHYTCFNGLYRENSRGDFNVPMGKNSKNLPYEFNLDKDLFINASSRLKNVDIFMYDYKSIINLVHTLYTYKKTLFFLDPPYLNTFSGYNNSGFKLKDHLELIELCKHIDNEGHYFMLFNSDNVLYNNLLSDYHQYTFYRKGSINSDPDKRKKVVEKMYTNC